MIANRRIIIASLVLFTVLIWLLSKGFTSDGSTTLPDNETSLQHNQIDPSDNKPFKVTVIKSQAQNYAPKLHLSGFTEADQEVTIDARRQGVVAETLVNIGSQVEKGQALLRIDLEDLTAKLAHAEAVIRQHALETEGARRLANKGYSASIKQRIAEAELANARLLLARTQLDIDHSTVRAPFAGSIAERFIDAGATVNEGEALFRLVNTNPLNVLVYISERDIRNIQPGIKAQIKLIAGDETSGVVHQIAPVANKTTRMFSVKIICPNPEGRLPAGVSAKVTLDLSPVRAHAIPPDALVLHDKGYLGVMLAINTIADNNLLKWKARFNKISILANEGGHIWIAGLPENASIITAGQGFLNDGQPIIPSTETGDVASTENWL